jgi:acetylornithine/N-succinyldiaminopimelate aminotransferase
MNLRNLFQQHLAPTSSSPMMLHINKASGAKLYNNDKEYIDLIGGISVCNTGHCHPKVLSAIKRQLDDYLHVMVYGEVIQSPQVLYASLLTQHLPSHLNSVYFTNSGAEAVEGAMKLAKRVTSRSEIIACHNSYHGSTQGALSIIGDEYWRNAFRPLLPGIRHIRHGCFEDLEYITEQTACIILEPIQAENGVRVPSQEWMKQLRSRCNETGTLMILDEIQTGFGRTGKLWAFEHFEIEPDILLLGKALGGGMPLGAFIASKEYMSTLAQNPVLGHLTTFGGHPVSCVAGKASMEVLFEEHLLENVNTKSDLFLKLLIHKEIKSVRSKGLMIAVELESFDKVQRLIKGCLDAPVGIFTDWFLFASDCIRIVPPLVISEHEITLACKTIVQILDTEISN